MSSTFYGLGISYSGLIASQEALDVTAQNLANVNTEGYSRQSLKMTSNGPYSGAYRFAVLGTLVGRGVSIDGVTQIRDRFLDTRYRTENSIHNTFSAGKRALEQIEDIFNEIGSGSSSDTATGLSGTLGDLISNLREYQNTPDDANLPMIIKASFDRLCQVLRSDYNQLMGFKAQEEGDLSIIVTGGPGLSDGGINAILNNIKSFNTQIATYELTGQRANDLRDQRDVLLDKLSGYVDITVSESANGMVSVAFQKEPTDGVKLIDEANNAATLSVVTDPATGETQISITNVSGTETPAMISDGTVKGYLNTLNGGIGSYTNLGIPALVQKLNDFANALLDIANNFIPSGQPLLTIGSGTLDTAAANITLSDEWIDDNSLFLNNFINADMGSDIGEYISSTISALSATGTVTEGVTEADPDGTGVFSGTLLDFADLFSTEIADETNTVALMASSTRTIVDNLDLQRKSVSSVSTDEEGINIIKYQKAYQANAKVITAIDEMLETLINMGGTV
jgi:flagellar hook-associated protein 1 FlgK